MGHIALKDLFPRLFRICNNQLDSVSSLGFWDGASWQWSLGWKRELRPRDVEELGQLNSILAPVTLDSKCGDKLIWASDKNRLFSVKAFTRVLDKSSPLIPSSSFKSLWKGLVPHRIEIFIWFVLLGRLNTRGKLAKLSIIPLAEAECVFCKNHIETEEHLFIHCFFVWNIWSWWLNIWGLLWVMPSSMQDLFLQWNYSTSSPFFKKVWKASFYIITWSIWKERNARVFTSSSCSPKQMQDLVLLRLFWWIKGWQGPFHYSYHDVIQNPRCLNIRSNAKQGAKALKAGGRLSWCPPSQHSVKWNIDASFDPVNNLSAIGGVLRNEYGNFMCIFSCPIPPMKINSAEVYAIF